jgi:hypothetical protein
LRERLRQVLRADDRTGWARLDPNLDDQGGWMVIEPRINYVVAGQRFDFDLDDVERFLSSQLASRG